MRHEGLNVFIKSVDLGEQLPEFPDPDASGDKSRCYVESTSGEKFAIVVDVYSSFKWHGAIGILISWSRDSSTSWTYYFPKTKQRSDPTTAVEISHVRYQQEGDTWLNGELTFAEYQFDDSTHHSTQEWKDADTKRGHIKVRVDRIKDRREGVWQPYPVCEGGLDDKAPIKVVKDKGISHRINPTNPKPCGNGTVRYSNIYFDGPPGRTIYRMFLYRPKYILRKLGVCPPSPVITAMEPVDLTELDGEAEDNDGEKVAEFVDLTQSGSRALQPKRERFVDDEDLEAELERTKQRQLDIQARLQQRAAGLGSVAASRAGTPRVKREISH